MTLTNMQRVHAMSKWRAVKRNIEHLERTVLTLMRHPDANAAQIEQARQCLIGIQSKLTEVQHRAVAHNLKFE